MPDLALMASRRTHAQSHDLLGTTLYGRYEVGDLLGRGGFASVMSGYDRIEKRPCAIKVFAAKSRTKRPFCAASNRKLQLCAKSAIPTLSPFTPTA